LRLIATALLKPLLIHAREKTKLHDKQLLRQASFQVLDAPYLKRLLFELQMFPLTLELLSGSCLNHNELELHATQHMVTAREKHFIIFIMILGQICSRGFMLISEVILQLQQQIPGMSEWVIFEPFHNKCKHSLCNALLQAYVVVVANKQNKQQPLSRQRRRKHKVKRYACSVSPKNC
jgi:hypothetical protein